MKISPYPSFSKRGKLVPPLVKGDEGGFECNFVLDNRKPAGILLQDNYKILRIRDEIQKINYIYLILHFSAHFHSHEDQWIGA